jgi:ribulose-bisphosphate carboxylase large chain
LKGKRREFVRATYRLRVGADQVEARAEAIHLEQTVELPREAVRDRHIEREILARVESIEADSEQGFRAQVAYPVATSAWDPAQLLNLLFGNTSLQPEIELVDVALPASLLDVLGGPQFGIEGWRKATGVAGRALTCTALKPMGLGPEELADLARTFARAGLDVVKDDHGLADHSFCRFEDRVRACQAAIDAVSSETGHRTLYVPNLTGTPESVFRQLELAAEVGVDAVMLSPMLVGLPLFCELARSRSPLPLVAHPALAGAQRIAPPVLLGTLFRAFGADAVIYPHFGGRFSYSEAVCRELAQRLRQPFHSLRPALPVVAGGMSVERVPELLACYGIDTMLLIGGSLYRAGPALPERSREFVDAVERASGDGP